MENQEITFVFHQKAEETKNNKNRTTVSAVLVNNTLKFGVATCGPKDHFCRKIGKAIAEGRAKKQPAFEVTFNPNSDIRFIRDTFFANALRLITVK